jgi:uncharacterized protein
VQVDLQGPAGRLEALYEAPPSPRFAAVVCHPHPQYGGTLHTHATYRLARAVRAQGGVTLRFNFRGVGRSAGHHDHGRGEVDDVRAALAWLAAEQPALTRWACGFSFGAWMALEAGCGDEAVPGILCAGLALSLRDGVADLARACPNPVAVVQAERDEFALPAQVERALTGAAAPRRLTVVDGASHLFTEALQSLEREASEAMAWLLEAAG